MYICIYREKERERVGKIWELSNHKLQSINSFHDSTYTLYLSFQIYKLSLITNMYISDIFKMLP